MTPAYLRQLTYMTERRSWADVSRQTGIPTRALKGIVSGKKEPETEWKNYIKNAFRRSAYAELKDAGFSAKEANRWAAYRPETVQLKTTLISYKIADLATGVLAMRLETTGQKTTKATTDKWYDSIYNSIKKGIQNSRRTTEEILEGDIT